MKRYPLVISATAAGLAGVLSFHSHSATVALRGASTNPATNPATTPPRSRSHATPQKTSTSATGSTTPTRTTSAKGRTPGKTAPSTSPAPGASTTRATGTLEQYGYGELSVRVTMAGGRITDVSVAKLQTADTYSQQLASYVIPILRREVLHAQSAKINGLSGATYTSEAYAYSLQSALDKLRK
jgi:uncharacterized protein with FMN-binding domain